MPSAGLFQYNLYANTYQAVSVLKAFGDCCSADTAAAALQLLEVCVHIGQAGKQEVFGNALPHQAQAAYSDSARGQKPLNRVDQWCICFWEIMQSLIYLYLPMYVHRFSGTLKGIYASQA